ncbi:hypothetical protein VS84_03082 [Vibrio cholerae]|nr:hypothetical protein VS84_03082 [Vibrio cholerae]KKP20589.1 hypothetical protein VS86_02736 [Vibrio cholerae]
MECIQLCVCHVGEMQFHLLDGQEFYLQRLQRTSRVLQFLV